jgi:predicted MFS family arabinose efflux permease
VAEPPRPQDWRLPVAIVGGIATLCVAAILFALSRVSADAQKEAAKEVPAVTQPERARER